MPKDITVEQGQCLMDIAIQHCGDAAAIFEIAELNSISVTEVIAPGAKLTVPDAFNPGVVNYLAEIKEVPATNDAAEGKEVKPEEGIDYWAIEKDFVVQ